MTKTLVIGGGLLGLCSARALQCDGHEIELLEARATVGEETSYANGGMLTASMSDPWNAPGVYKQLVSSFFDPHSAMKLRIHAVPSLFFWGLKFLLNSSRVRHTYTTEANYRLASYSIEKTRELREQLSPRYNASCSGSLKIFRSKDAMRRPVALAELLAKQGLVFKQLDAEGAAEVEPQLAGICRQLSGALYFPDDESGDALLFCRELARTVEQEGGLVRTGVSVFSLIIEKGRVIGVETDSGAVMADRIVVAAGTYTPRVLKGTGLALPIKPAKGYSVTIELDDFEQMPVVPVIDDAIHAAIAPLGKRLRCVGTAEFTGYDTSINQQRIDNLLNLLDILYPHIAARADRTKAESWAGLRPMSCDGKPFIGACSVSGLYFNTGHGHLGWTMAMGSACLLADLVSGRQPAIDSEPFRIHR